MFYGGRPTLRDQFVLAGVTEERKWLARQRLPPCPSPRLDRGLLEENRREHLEYDSPVAWPTSGAQRPELQKHSSELESVLSLFSKHGINVKVVVVGGWGGREGTYLSFSEVEVDGDLVAP